MWRTLPEPSSLGSEGVEVELSRVGLGLFEVEGGT